MMKDLLLIKNYLMKIIVNFPLEQKDILKLSCPKNLIEINCRFKFFINRDYIFSSGCNQEVNFYKT